MTSDDDTISYSGTVLHLGGRPDASGEVIDPSCIIKTERPIPVHFGDSSNFRNIVGDAYVYKDIKRPEIKYMAEIRMDLTRLTKEQLDQMRPCMVGRILKRNGNIIEKFVPQSISLNILNVDPRIKKLGEDE